MPSKRQKESTVGSATHYKRYMEKRSSAPRFARGCASGRWSGPSSQTLPQPAACFNCVQTRWRPGSVTTRKPYQYQCVYVYEGKQNKNLLHACKSQFNALKILSKLPKPQGTQEGRDTSLHRHTMFTPKIRRKLASQHNSKELAAHVPSPS